MSEEKTRDADLLQNLKAEPYPSRGKYEGWNVQLLWMIESEFEVLWEEFDCMFDEEHHMRGYEQYSICLKWNVLYFIHLLPNLMQSW